MARRRVNSVLATQALGFYAAAAAVLAGGKSLEQFLERLEHDE